MSVPIRMSLLLKTILIEAVKGFFALVASFIALFFSITVGAGTSVLGTAATYGTTSSSVLSIIGTSIPMIFISLLTYGVFAHSRIRSIWTCLFFVIPIQIFWMHLSITSVLLQLKWTSGVNFLAITVALIFVILRLKKRHQLEFVLKNI
jgi:hypothetical protein